LNRSEVTPWHINKLIDENITDRGGPARELFSDGMHEIGNSAVGFFIPIAKFPVVLVNSVA